MKTAKYIILLLILFSEFEVKSQDNINSALTFIEENRKFLLDFDRIISSQETDVEMLVGHFEEALGFTQSISELSEKNTDSIRETQSMFESIEGFYSQLKIMSGSLQEISDDLDDHIERLDATLSRSDG